MAYEGERPTFGSLFAGIGGFDLGLERAGWRCAWQVEIDAYCRGVLAKHWPDVPRYGDIRDVKDLEPVDLICGGFPCQPVSQAGLKGAQSDPRWLWPEFARILGYLRPQWALLENVPGLLRRGFGDVLRDLAALGYDCTWDCIPAGAFGAHFRGDRLFVLAYSPEAGGGRWQMCWPTPVGSNQWGRDEFEGLVRLEVEHGVPAGSLGRISDGVPRRMDRLRGLGNAVVPQVAEWIGLRILEAHLDGVTSPG